jgi:hypothetical protein
MPRVRTSRVFCDCLDCTDTNQAPVERSDRAALQDPPPRCLVVYASDVVWDAEGPDSTEPASARLFPHLDAVAKEGSSGMLALHTGEDDSLALDENLVYANEVTKYVLLLFPADKDGTGSSMHRLDSLAQLLSVGR